MAEDGVFEELEGLVTEAPNLGTAHLDLLSTRGILELINKEDRTVPGVVAEEIPYVEQAVELIVRCFRQGGRLLYVGAGTSGRLGVMDAAECPPTFGTPPEMVQGIVAGGYAALVRAQEGAEDREEAGAADLEQRGVACRDVVVGISASRRTPYVLGALRKAREVGAATVFLTCNPRAELKVEVDVAICPVVGPEVVTGSTRMKAATAQRLVLGMLSTASMIRLGKVYGNLMVDLQATSRKLVERSKRVIMLVTGLDYRHADDVLGQAGGSVKTALVMVLAGVGRAEAQQRLADGGGFVAQAVSPQEQRKAVHMDVDNPQKP